MTGHMPAVWQQLWTASAWKSCRKSGLVPRDDADSSIRNRGNSTRSLFLSKDCELTSCLIFLSKGPFPWNSVTIPDSSDSCLITACRSSTRWDGVWGWREEGARLHQREISVWTNKPTNPIILQTLTSIFRGPYFISWAASACLNGVGVRGELSRIDFLIAGVLKLQKNKGWLNIQERMSLTLLSLLHLIFFYGIKDSVIDMELGMLINHTCIVKKKTLRTSIILKTHVLPALGLL